MCNNDKTIYIESVGTLVLNLGDKTAEPSSPPKMDNIQERDTIPEAIICGNTEDTTDPAAAYAKRRCCNCSEKNPNADCFVTRVNNIISSGSGNQVFDDFQDARLGSCYTSKERDKACTNYRDEPGTPLWFRCKYGNRQEMTCYDCNLNKANMAIDKVLTDPGFSSLGLTRSQALYIAINGSTSPKFAKILYGI